MIKQKSLTFTHILKRSFSSVITQLNEKLFSFNKIEKSLRSVKQLKSCNITLTNIKDFEQFSNSMNIAMIKIMTYKTLIKWSDVNIFVIIILKIDWFISTAENKLKSMNLHELSYAETFEQIKVKLLFKYHDYLNIFDWVMINQLSFHHFYDNNNNSYTFVILIRLTHEKNLCYVYQVNKILWDRKSLAVYTIATCSQDDKTETMYQICSW